MFDLTKSEMQLLDIAEKQFQNTINEARFLHGVRLASILESHGVRGDTPGRFVRAGENKIVWVKNEEPAESNPEPAAEPEE